MNIGVPSPDLKTLHLGCTEAGTRGSRIFQGRSEAESNHVAHFLNKRCSMTSYQKEESHRALLYLPELWSARNDITICGQSTPANDPHGCSPVPLQWSGWENQMGNSEKSCRLIRQFSSYSNSCVYRHSQEPTLVFLVLSVSSSTPAAPIFSIVYPESEGPFPSGSSKCLPGSQGLQYQTCVLGKDDTARNTPWGGIFLPDVAESMVLGLCKRAALGESMARTGFSCQQRQQVVGLPMQKTSHW